VTGPVSSAATTGRGHDWSTAAVMMATMTGSIDGF
jgi:hypothetical protein